MHTLLCIMYMFKNVVESETVLLFFTFLCTYFLDLSTVQKVFRTGFPQTC